MTMFCNNSSYISANTASRRISERNKSDRSRPHSQSNRGYTGRSSNVPSIYYNAYNDEDDDCRSRGIALQFLMLKYIFCYY